MTMGTAMSRMVLAALLFAAGPALAAGAADEVELLAGEEASFSPDGTKILFQRQVGEAFRVGVREVATGAETWVRTDGNALQPSWTPDGGILYTWGHSHETALSADRARSADGYNLWLWKDGADRRLTTGRVRDYSAACAPDGRVYCASTRGAEGREKPGDFINASYLYRVETDGRTTCLHEALGNRGGVTGPRVSPDGRLLVWGQTASFAQTWRLMLARVDSPDRHLPITPMTMCAYAPAWHPDGVHLAFTGFTPGDSGWGVYLMHVRSGALRRVGDGRNPSFADNGRRLVYDRAGTVYARTLAASDFPPPSSVAEPDPLADVRCVRATFRYRPVKELSHVFQAIYPEHPLGLQLFFKPSGELCFATRGPDGGYVWLPSRHVFRDGEEAEVVCVRTRDELYLCVNGCLDSVRHGDGYLKLSAEPRKVLRGGRFPGEVRSVEFSHAWPAELEKPLTRAGFFAEEAK